MSNVLRFIAGKEPLPDFDGHANCFIETGDGKAMLIDFNYETEPLPGRFPLPGIGPFTLLEESAQNHWGKLAFKWVYWNVLLAGKELPMDHRMLMAGKWS
jgi:sulfide:quinone oxidoreductase